jgi:superfamily II DNA/RNA helicase
MILNNDENGGNNCDIVGIAETGSGKTLVSHFSLVHTI